MNIEKSKRLWQITQATHQLWFLASLYCVAGVFTALIGIFLEPYLSKSLHDITGAGSVNALLTIIASSMLTVTIFSLSTLVQASTAAASNATPRAVGTLLEDRIAQAALSTFLGAFMFSLVGLIALNTNLYSSGGRFVLFLATLLVITLIITTLLRWISHLGHLGQVTRTISQVESSARNSMINFRSAPFLYAKPWNAPLPTGLHMIEHNQIGYLSFVDIAAIDSLAERLNTKIYLLERPGAFITPGRYIAGLMMEPGQEYPDDASMIELSKSFTIGQTRNYGQDPLYGLIVLSQIALRALSPAVNDPGTAIDVLGNLVRVLASGPVSDKTIHHENVYIQDIPAEEFFDAAFTAISRDGAGMVEVGLRLQRALDSLGVLAFPDYSEAAREFSTIALERACSTLQFPRDIARLEILANNHCGR